MSLKLFYQWINSLTTDEAGGLQNFFFLLFFTPQVGKGVDDHTKDEVENNDDDHEEEQQVVYHSGCKQWLLGKEADTCRVNLKVKNSDFHTVMPLPV